MAFVDNRHEGSMKKDRGRPFERALFVYGDLASAYYQGRLDNRDMSKRPPSWEEVEPDFVEWYNENFTKPKKEKDGR